ncbi:MAG: HypC/HybG/HupF family hydrogenase formation chaperone [Candidatus Woesearchaeota archaeon]
MEVEVYFLKYSFPCAFIANQRGVINFEEFKRLEDAAINNKVLPREFLEKVFVMAFGRIQKLADELGKDKWNFDVIKEYFITRHNDIIDQGFSSYAKAPESLKNLCRIHKAKVLEIRDDFLIVEYGGNRKRTVMKSLVPGVSIGDSVSIHYGYAVEIL